MGRLIDADRLKAHYCWWAGGSKEMSIDEAKKTFDTIIDVQPTADAEKHGRWDTKYLSEDEDWSGIEHTIGRCSVCRGKIDIVGERIPYLYCPFCGAKMDEVEDG